MDAVKTPKLIGIYSPAAQMGKSTATAFLTHKLGFGNMKFAGPLKAMTTQFLRELGVPEEQVPLFVEGHLKEEPLSAFGFDSLTSRYIQQTIGTDWGRNCLDRNLWTTLTARKARAAIDRGERIVIDDMRFPNEYDLVKSMGGECWCVYRPEVPITVSSHPSEGLLSEFSFDHSLINTGPVENLHGAILEAITRF